MYMMALGAVPHARGVPSSYYGRVTERAGSRARFILCYPGSVAHGEGGRRIAAVAGGCVLERPERNAPERPREAR